MNMYRRYFNPNLKEQNKKLYNYLNIMVIFVVLAIYADSIKSNVI